MAGRHRLQRNFHGWISLVIQYRQTTSLLLILMTALQSLLPCACEACESALGCGVGDHQGLAADGGHSHCHKIHSTTALDEAVPPTESGPASGRHHDSAPAIPVKGCSCLRCVTVSMELVRPPQRLKSATPFCAGNVEVAIPLTVASNSSILGFRNTANCALTRERDLVRLQV